MFSIVFFSLCQTLPSGLLAFCQPALILNLKNQSKFWNCRKKDYTNIKEKIHPQELGKKLRVPMIRWGGMCAGENTQAGKTALTDITVDLPRNNILKAVDSGASQWCGLQQ